MIKRRNLDQGLQTWIRSQANFYGLRHDARTLFVDGDNGADTMTGLDDPENAVKSVGKAITNANANSVIYVFPKNWTSANGYLGGTPYREASVDLSIPYAKQGLAIVGVGHHGLNGPPYGLLLEGIAANTASILKVHAPMVVIENMGFFSVSGDSTVSGLEFNGDIDGTSEANAVSVYNCHFDGCGRAIQEVGGAIFGTGVWGITVDQCTFMGCRAGITLKSGTRSAGKMILKNLEFSSRLASPTDISHDIYVMTDGSMTASIHDIYCAHKLPAYSGGGNLKYISAYGERVGAIYNIHCANGQTTALTCGHTGTGITAPEAWGVWLCFDGFAAMAHA